MHPSARIYEVLGTSFAYSQEKILELCGRLGRKKRGDFPFFCASREVYPLTSRRDNIRQMAIAIGKMNKWPTCLVILFFRKGNK